MVVMRVHFHSVGKWPSIDRLNSFVKLGAINAAVDCSITADILSDPVDFAGSRFSGRSGHRPLLRYRAGAENVY